MKVFVTGATGLLGSNVCTMLIERGHQARATVRDLENPDAVALRKAGVEVVPGDINDLASMQKASEGVDAVVHSAAMLGRPGATWEEGFPTNVIGTINVLSAAAMAGGPPVVQVLTTTFFDSGDEAFSEFSPLDLKFANKDVYSATKRLAYVEGVARAATGQDIRFMIPGAIYGSTVCLEKGLGVANFNQRLVKAIRGEMTTPQLPLPMPWVTARDCAFVCIEAIDKGERGQRYIAHGDASSRRTIAEACNIACEMAGVPHRVRQLTIEELEAPDMIEKFGPTNPQLARNASNKAPTNSRYTQEKLGYRPTPIAEGFPQTLDWMRSVGAI